MFRKLLSLTVIGCFFLTTLSPLPNAHADSVLGLPAPGTMINLSSAYEPVIIKGLTVHKDNPFLFDFIVDVGQDKLSGQPLKIEGEKLIKYFLASLAIPDKDVWVNLSPYERNRMIPEALGKTDMGRDLLEQDYILKQITASLIYPEKDLGKKFWDTVYAKAQQTYGTTEVPVNTFNKVWILADRAEVFEHNQTAFVVNSHLKVMLEEDYLALQKHVDIGVTSTKTTVNSIGSQFVRKIVLPELEKEVNTGKNFSHLRQIVNSLILANWYKNNLKQALLNQVYTNQSKVKGIDLNDPTVKQQIYEQYLKAYKKGVFNYIKEDVTTQGDSIPRKYFSGGFGEAQAVIVPRVTDNQAAYRNALPRGNGRLIDFETGAFLHKSANPDDAMLTVQDIKPSIVKTIGNKETLRVDVTLVGGAQGHFVQPAGTSSGDDERKTEDDLNKVIENVQKIHAEVVKQRINPDQLAEIGQLMLKMDSQNFLGAQATLAYQMANAWAVARAKGLELYQLIREIAPDLASKKRGSIRTKIQYNITNGGAHAANSLDMQEFMIVPTGKTKAESNKMADNVDRELGLVYQALGLQANPNDHGLGNLRGLEGGYSIPNFTQEKLQELYKNADSYNVKNLNLSELRDRNVGLHEFILNALMAAVKNAGYKVSKSGEVGTVALAIDLASSEMYNRDKKTYSFEGRDISPEELTNVLDGWVKTYPLDSIEDAMDQNDWDGWMVVIKALGDKVLLIADDNLVTQERRLMIFINKLKENGLVDANGKVTKKVGILIKLNQNGFLTTGIDDPAKGYLGTLEVVRLAKQHGMEAVISHRSKEAQPEDNEVSIADLAGGVDAYGLKSGDHVQSFRAVKENRLAEIERQEIEGAAQVGQGEKAVDQNLPNSAGVTRKAPGEVDSAALANGIKTENFTRGGIDLNTSSGMKWKVSKDGNGVEINIDPTEVARIQREGIDWLSPVIFRMTPVPSVWALGGLQAPSKGGSLAGV